MSHWCYRVLLAAAVIFPAAGALGQIIPYHGPSYTRNELAPGVWAFVFDNGLGDRALVDGTALVIINDADVVVVDAQGTPTTARRVLAEIRKLTPKPVRYVITTHWHGDHWLGNQVYQEAFPGVEFIAHPNNLEDLEALELPGLDSARNVTMPRTLKDMEQGYAKSVRRDGKSYSPQDSVLTAGQIAAFRWAIPAMKEIRPVKPTLLVADSLTLRRGERTIVVRFLGRGNTRGDLSVWLPKERILATGDLLVNPAPYSFGSFLREWVQTLTKLHQLPAAVIVPGHGAIQRDWAYVDLFVELLNSTLGQAKDAVAKGLDLEATRKAVDLTAFRERFAGGDDLKGLAFDAFFVAPAVERAWLEARGELDKAPR
ncbi:MAG: MBL fold metallo-hydrolase [Gemmatimonadota bacterium]